MKEKEYNQLIAKLQIERDNFHRDYEEKQLIGGKRMNAKEKAMEYLKKNLNLNYKQTLWLPHLEKAIDLAIQEAKKEVFDDIIEINEPQGNLDLYIDYKKFNKLKKRHLSKKQLIGGKDGK